MEYNSGKIAIIGANRMGSLCAWSLAMHGIGGQIRLIDADRPKASVQTTDLSDAAIQSENSVQILSGSYADCADAQVALICVEDHQWGGCTRGTSLTKTAQLVSPIAQALKESGFNGAVVLMCSYNDVMVRYFQEMSGFPASKVIGGEALLCNLRLRRLLGEAFGVTQNQVELPILGESGESQAVIWSAACISGQPMLQYMSAYPETLGRIDLSAIAGKARRLGNFIQEGKGYEEFGLTNAACMIVRAILDDGHTVLPVSTALEGAYGQNDLFAVTPAVIGKNGVERIVEIAMEGGENAEFIASCQALRNLYKELCVTCGKQ